MISEQLNSLYGDENSWTQLLKISYQSLPSKCDEYSQWLPLHLSDHSNTLILANNEDREAILYNLKDKTAERIRILDEIQWFSAKVYVESLVSVI